MFGTSGISLWHLTDVAGSTTKNGYKNFIVGNLVYGNKNNLPWKDGDPPAIYDGNGIIVDDARHTQRPGGIYDGSRHRRDPSSSSWRPTNTIRSRSHSRPPRSLRARTLRSGASPLP